MTSGYPGRGGDSIQASGKKSERADEGEMRMTEREGGSKCGRIMGYASG